MNTVLVLRRVAYVPNPLAARCFEADLSFDQRPEPRLRRLRPHAQDLGQPRLRRVAAARQQREQRRAPLAGHPDGAHWGADHHHGLARERQARRDWPVVLRRRRREDAVPEAAQC